MVNAFVPVTVRAPGGERAIGGSKLCAAAYRERSTLLNHNTSKQLHWTKERLPGAGRSLLTAVCVFAADATSNAGALAVAVFSIDDASPSLEFSANLNSIVLDAVTGHQAGAGAGSSHGESKEEDNGGEDVGGQHFRGGCWVLELVD